MKRTGGKWKSNKQKRKASKQTNKQKTAFIFHKKNYFFSFFYLRFKDPTQNNI